MERRGSSAALSTSYSGPSTPVAPNSLLVRLKQEAKLLSSLNHPNVVDFLGVCTTPPGCILTAYCERGSLRDVLAAAKTDPAAAAELTWERRLEMAIGAAQGMKYLHGLSQPVVHRDLKSPNLRVDGAWNVKVADFNLSRLLTSAGRSMAASKNPQWVAPEVLRGSGSGPAADAFAFGVILWELLTWDMPWEGVDPPAVVSAVLTGQRLAVPAESELPGTQDLPTLDRYVALMNRCWATEASRRPTFFAIVRELRIQQEAVKGAVQQLQLNRLKSAIEPIKHRWK